MKKLLNNIDERKGKGELPLKAWDDSLQCFNFMIF